MSLATLSTTVLPVFGFIAIGYVIVAIGIIKAETGDALGTFVFNIAVPLLLFRALGTLALPDVSPWPLWGIYLSAVSLNIAVSMLLTEKAFHRDARAGVIGGMSGSFSNLVMVGVPVVTQAFGAVGQVTMFVLIAVHLPFMMLVSAILIEIAEYRDGQAASRIRLLPVFVRVIRSSARNPLVIAIAAGVAFRLTGLPLVGLPSTLIDRLADTAIPLALLSLGMSLHRYGVGGNILPAIVLSVVKLMVMPAIVYVLAVHVARLPAMASAVLVLGAACPTGVNAYLIAVRFQTGLALSANTITLTTAASIATFTMWLAIVAAT